MKQPENVLFCDRTWHYAIVARQDRVDGLKRLADYRATLDKTPAAQKVVPIASATL